MVSMLDLTAAAGRVSQAAGPAINAADTAAVSSTAGASSASTGTSVSSNDFLKLLVTEMKNQDPTQPTDPNAYIQQLVGVNSLQQLIAINKDLNGTTSSTQENSIGRITTG